MFYDAYDLNQPIGSWNTSAVTDMQYMFYRAWDFDTPLGLWDISSLTSYGHYKMLNASLMPPCEAGRGPGRNLLMCERCGVGQYAPAQSFCQECPEGSTPSADRTTCEDCPMMHYSVSGMDECVPCNLPLALVDNRCVWWHLPLLALGLGALGVCGGLVFSWNRSRKAKKIERILEEVYMELWDEQPNTLDAYSKKLYGLGLQKLSFDQHISGMRALQGQRAGVSIGYLLSADFAQLAIQRTGKDDPTFTDMKAGFWLSEDAIGEDIICPRDGRPGCALVDWIPRRERREQTHFMSWTWKYSLQQVRSALEVFQENLVGPCYFFMCFFANNQYRILVEESSSGSDNLEQVFKTNLKRIGKMVAMLDTWDQPMYLTRVWTVYEQFVASTIQIEVEFIMPRDASDLMQRQIAQGSDGIDEVIKSLSQVNSEEAKAWKMEDEIRVKSLIQDSVGFKHVDVHVTNVMITWIGSVLEQTCRELLDRARGKSVLKKGYCPQIPQAGDQRSRRISL